MGHVNLNGESNGEASTEETDQEEEIRPEEATCGEEEEATDSQEVGPQTGSQTVWRGADVLITRAGTGAECRPNDSAADARAHNRVIVDAVRGL